MLIWLLTLATVGQAQPAPTCPAAPPAELAGWGEARPAAASADAEAATTLRVGGGFRAALRPTARVAYPVEPAKPGPGAHGGLFAFDVTRPGRHRVALSSPGWIEVVRDGRAVPSASHAHGPACSGIRKVVDFDLALGRHLLQIAGAPAASVNLMVARLP